MKKIKDYLHLYLNANVKCRCLSLVDREGWITDLDVYLIIDLFDADSEICAVMPILRKLEDMSEEEDQEFNLINRGNWIDMHWYPEGFLWLISHGFDLFNLIPDGLAIDSKTLKI